MNINTSNSIHHHQYSSMTKQLKLQYNVKVGPHNNHIVILWIGVWQHHNTVLGVWIWLNLYFQGDTSLTTSENPLPFLPARKISLVVWPALSTFLLAKTMFSGVACTGSYILSPSTVRTEIFQTQRHSFFYFVWHHLLTKH